MFFSKEQIELSVKRLTGLNPFFGTVFLALKELNIPVGETTSVNFLPTVEAFLQRYYRPTPDYIGFYTPFKTSNSKKRWNTYQYANSLHRVAVDTFSDVLAHPKGSREWGWKPDYIETLWEEHLLFTPIPTFDLAVWLYRLKEWNDKTQTTDIMSLLFSDFNITHDELSLFDTRVLSFPEIFQEKVINTNTLLDIIGLPPQENVPKNRYPSTTLPKGSTSAMKAEDGTKLQMLKLIEVGPSEEMELDLAPRVNLITGDNALGKTFLLECAWWALTGTWASKYPARPNTNAPKEKPSISFQIGKEALEERLQVARYNWREQSWIETRNRRVLPGLAIFFQADSSCAIWDPIQKSPQLTLFDEVFTSDAFTRLSQDEIWTGKKETHDDKTIVKCRGLIEDWITWQNASEEPRYQAFLAALHALSPHTNYRLVPGTPTRIPEDARSIPTLDFPYGSVPIVYCSSGIKRIISLAYLLVWSWYEHLENAILTRENPQRSIVLLIDEMEAHLHPLWQRVIVPAIMSVIKVLSEQVETQIIIATHSPLVLASMEPDFDEDQDSLFHLELDLEDGLVQLNEVPFVKMGRVDHWLVSDIFGLEQPRSVEAEKAIAEANELQLERNPSAEKIQVLNNTLVRVLGAEDEYWPIWRYFLKQRREKVI